MYLTVMAQSLDYDSDTDSDNEYVNEYQKTYTYASCERLILVNCKYGHFGFSNAFYAEMERRSGVKPKRMLSRSDPSVVNAAIEFGLREASGDYAKLGVFKVPAYMNYRIYEYDGMEDIVLEFPWKEFALASYNKNDSEPILVAVRSGEVKLPRSP